MIRTFIAAFFLLFAAGASANTESNKTIDSFLHQQMQQQNIPGLAVGVFQNGKTLYLGTHGLANIEHKVPTNQDTVFQSGSLGKMFTAVAVMLLVDDGRVKLDESVRTYLPELPPSWQAITVRHLLHHTGGVPNASLDLQKDYSDAEMLAAYAAKDPKFKAGSRWEYSNGGYAVLGLMVNKVTGQHFGELLRQRVFMPLKMNSARVISERDIVVNRASGYDLTDDGLKNQNWVSPSLNATGDGALYLSLEDYRKWFDALGKRAILSPASWQAMFSPAKLNNGDIYPYGFGVDMSLNIDGQNVIGHSGGWQGFSAEFSHYMHDNVSIVVLTNSSAAKPDMILQGVAERYNPAYRLPKPQVIADRNTVQTAALAAILAKLQQGRLKHADIPHFPAVRFQGWLKQQQTTLAGKNDCRQLALLKETPSGDTISRQYRWQCRQGQLGVHAVFEGTHILRFWVSE